MKKNTRLKYKRPPLDLFTVATITEENQVFERLINEAKKLEKEVKKDFITSCECWWRSRFAEMLGMNQAKSHEEWLYRYRAQMNWPLIWQRFQIEYLGHKRQTFYEGGKSQ